MGLDGVVIINKSIQLHESVGIILKFDFVMQHFHESADNSLGFTVGLGTVDLGEFLANVVGLARDGECVAAGTPVRLAVVRVGVFDLVGALRQHVVDEKPGGAILGFVWQDVSVQLTGEVINYPKGTRATNRYSLDCVADWPLSRGKRLVSK